MTEVALRLKDEMLRLPDEDRPTLARILYDSVDGELDEGVDAEWETELNRRSEEMHSGKDIGVPADVVFAEFREKRS